MIGRILKGVGGYYTVLCDGEEYFCIARGRFRKESIKPLVGDMVEFMPPEREEEYGAVANILPRETCTLRPPIANVNLILVTMAAASPQPDLLLMDRLLARAQVEGCEAVVVVNKIDLAQDTYQDLCEQYRLAGYRVFPVSAQKGEGIEELREVLQGHISCFAGQSGAGKSSLLNALFPGLGLETGGVSRIERGRHTTRHAQLLPLEDGGFVADTPGFSLLELDTRPPETLKECYPEMHPYEGQCRFEGCMHHKEPGCAVKAAAERGEISKQRLQRYGVLLEEMKEKWGKRYD